MQSTSTSPLRLPRSLKEMVERLRRAATAVAEKVSALQTASAAAMGRYRFGAINTGNFRAMKAGTLWFANKTAKHRSLAAAAL
jgi:hypothetical protein